MSKEAPAIMDTPSELLVIGADLNGSAWLQRGLGDAISLRIVDGHEPAELIQRQCAAIVLGQDLDGDQKSALMATLSQASAAGNPIPPIMTIGPGPADLTRHTTLYYAIPPQMESAELQALVHSAVGGGIVALPRQRTALACPTEARQIQRILELSRRLALQPDLASAEAVCLAAIRELTDCDRAYCLFYDAETGALWSEADTDADDDRRAVCGLAGFSARTGLSRCVARAAADPCYARAIDDPAGGGEERLLTQAVTAADGQVHAVFIAVRAPQREPFTTVEQTQLGAFAEQANPLFERLGLHLEAEALIEAESDKGVFRREALEAYSTHSAYGDVVRVSPRWADWAYRLIIAFAIAALGYAAVASIAQYSTGPAVVGISGRSSVTAHSAAVVAAVHVVPGQQVAHGEPLVQFYDAEQRATVDLLEHEFAAQLRNRLLDPADQTTEQSVRTLRAELDRARAALETRTVRAPNAGVISDVRVRPGQHVSSGDILMSIGETEGELYITALLPGGDRPQLASGMALRLEISGYRYAYQRLSIDSVASEVIGPAEARRFLGPQIGDVPTIDGPVVLVRARLPGRAFEADGHRYRYHDGMLATAHVQVRSQSILKTLVPGLERLQ